MYIFRLVAPLSPINLLLFMWCSTRCVAVLHAQPLHEYSCWLWCQLDRKVDAAFHCMPRAGTWVGGWVERRELGVDGSRNKESFYVYSLIYHWLQNNVETKVFITLKKEGRKREKSWREWVNDKSEGLKEERSCTGAIPNVCLEALSLEEYIVQLIKHGTVTPANFFSPWK